MMCPVLVIVRKVFPVLDDYLVCCNDNRKSRIVGYLWAKWRPNLRRGEWPFISELQWVTDRLTDRRHTIHKGSTMGTVILSGHCRYVCLCISTFHRKVTWKASSFKSSSRVWSGRCDMFSGMWPLDSTHLFPYDFVQSFINLMWRAFLSCERG